LVTSWVGAGFIPARGKSTLTLTLAYESLNLGKNKQLAFSIESVIVNIFNMAPPTNRGAVFF
jgi:hypothetical protein